MIGMTGYASNEFYIENAYISTEIKTVNHRFLEVNIHLPSILNSFEIEIRNLITKSFVRGKIDVNVYIKLRELACHIEPNFPLIEQYMESFRSIISKFRLQEEIKLEHLIPYDDILIVENKKDFSVYWEAIKASLEKNVMTVNSMREKEGRATNENFSVILEQIEVAVQNIAEHVPEMEEAIYRNMKTKMTDLLGGQVSEERLLNEVGILVSKSCVNEEIERLKHHLTHFRLVCKESADIGKRLDFLCQEMHREINTLGSKISLLSIIDDVIKVKNSIEKLREQIRNIV